MTKLNRLNKIDIVDRIAPSAQDRPYTERIMMKAFGEIAAALSEGNEVYIHGFGIFQPVAVAAREVRNLRTGETMTAPAKVKMRFKPAKGLLEAVNT